MTTNNGPKWKNEQDRFILSEIYKAFATAFDENRVPTEFQSWFRGAGIVEHHPVKMSKTIVINCNFKPFLIIKDVLALGDKFGLPVYLQEVDANGNPKA